jgi:Nuclease-related domain
VAEIVGQSGPWQEIVSDLARRGYPISSPRELRPLLATIERTRPQMINANRAHTIRSVQELTTRIAALTVERGFFKRLIGWFRIRALSTEIAALHEADSRYSSDLDQAIVHFRSLLNSAELAGAEAELAVIDHLRTLPSSTVVFNDIRLKAARYIRFNGKALISAQIDHVVLTPAGVFIIETKRWSHRFVESGDFHNPFDQVSRANYLCYDLLRKRFGKTRVRSIIACGGSLPDAPRESFVKVVRPESLTSYILGFRNTELAPRRLSKMRSFFEQRVGSPNVI